MCDEALGLLGQGKTNEARRLLEAAIRQHPGHLPSRIALIDVAIREGDLGRAITDGRTTITYAMARCKEAGVVNRSYAAHPEGVLFLKALRSTGRAYWAAGKTSEATNTLVAVLQEDPSDRLGVCADLVSIFFDGDRPEGVVGLFRLGFTHGTNLLDVVLAGLLIGDLASAYDALVTALESVPEATAVLGALHSRDAVEEAFVGGYFQRRSATWRRHAGMTGLAKLMRTHALVERTMDLVTELDEDESADPLTRAKLFQNLRAREVAQRVIESLRQ